jgi:hypothetical protein
MLKERPPKYDRPISSEDALMRKDEFLRLKNEVQYIGNPEHKESSGHDLGCIPPSQPKREKTKCDRVGIFEKRKAIALLCAGFRKGLVSPNELGQKWPRRVWAVTENGEVLEARYSGNGQYHGFPVLDDAALEHIIKKRWNQTNE